jgi:hypothetical protein
MRTSALTGAALDWAVAKAIGEYKPVPVPNYSTDWAQGGPIIEREKLCVDVGHDGVWLACIRQNYGDLGEYMHAAGGPLIAAMRCYVASKLGDEVEIPAEFLTTGETA